MNILDEIMAHKRLEVQQRVTQVPLEQLQTAVRQIPVVDFAAALRGPGLQVIAEVKRSSPSAGQINVSADPVELARSYAANGAAAISVLTDKKYFGGSLADLIAVKAAVNIPVLRKDFIVTEYQVYESYRAGADAILLITDALSNAALHNLFDTACELGLAVLMEAHNPSAVARLKKVAPEIAGVNSRNLTTMRTDVSYFEKMVDRLPIDSIKVAESGLFTPANLRYVAGLGYDVALVGTALMQADDPGVQLQKLLAGAGR